MAPAEKISHGCPRRWGTRHQQCKQDGVKTRIANRPSPTRAARRGERVAGCMRPRVWACSLCRRSTRVQNAPLNSQRRRRREGMRRLLLTIPSTLILEEQSAPWRRCNMLHGAVIETTSTQKTHVFMASRLVSSAWTFLFVVSADEIVPPPKRHHHRGASPCFPASASSESSMAGTPVERCSPKKAAQRQPMEVTPIANSGAINAPPTGTARYDGQARARWRMNQLLATTIGEWTNPATNARRSCPDRRS